MNYGVWEQKVDGLKKLGQSGCGESSDELMCSLTHCGWGILNCLNARSRCLNNVIQLLYSVSLKIYNKFANYFCEMKFSGNTHQRP